MKFLFVILFLSGAAGCTTLSSKLTRQAGQRNWLA